MTPPPLPFAWVSKFAGRHTPANGVISIEGERKGGRCERGWIIKTKSFFKNCSSIQTPLGAQTPQRKQQGLGGGYVAGVGRWGMGSWQQSLAKSSGIPADEVHHRLTLQTQRGPFSCWSLSFLRKMEDYSTSSPHAPQHPETPLIGRMN